MNRVSTFKGRYSFAGFGTIPEVFSDGIRAGNAVRLQLGVKLRNYSD